MVAYTQPGDWDDHGDDISALDGAHTRTLYFSDPLSDPVWTWIRRHVDSSRMLRGPALITTEERWEGYSEFTVWERWTSVVVTAPEMGYEHRWNTLAEFLKDMVKMTEDD